MFTPQNPRLCSEENVRFQRYFSRKTAFDAVLEPPMSQKEAGWLFKQLTTTRFRDDLPRRMLVSHLLHAFPSCAGYLGYPFHECALMMRSTDIFSSLST